MRKPRAISVNPCKPDIALQRGYYAKRRLQGILHVLAPQQSSTCLLTVNTVLEKISAMRCV